MNLSNLGCTDMLYLKCRVCLMYFDVLLMLFFLPFTFCYVLSEHNILESCNFSLFPLNKITETMT